MVTMLLREIIPTAMYPFTWNTDRTRRETPYPKLGENFLSVLFRSPGNMVTIFKNNAASGQRSLPMGIRGKCRLVCFFSPWNVPIWKKRKNTRERERENWVGPAAGILNCIRWIFADTGAGNRYVAMVVVVCAHSSLLYTRYRMHVIYVPMHIYPTEALRKRDSARLFKLLNFKLSLTYAN